MHARPSPERPVSAQGGLGFVSQKLSIPEVTNYSTHTLLSAGIRFSGRLEFGTPDRTRTCDLLLRRQLLNYPSELLAHFGTPYRL